MTDVVVKIGGKGEKCGDCGFISTTPIKCSLFNEPIRYDIFDHYYSKTVICYRCILCLDAEKGLT